MRRNFMKLALAATAVALMAGCATGIKHEQMASSMPSVKAGEGRIYFFRPASFVGGGLQSDIRLNGQVVGESKSGGFFFVDRAAGNYVATASTETEKSVSFVLKAGETKYIRSSVGFGLVVGRIILEPETPEKAKTELATLSYTGAPLAAK
jgi:hypothetical protein